MEQKVIKRTKEIKHKVDDVFEEIIEDEKKCFSCYNRFISFLKNIIKCVKSVFKNISI